MSTDAPRMDRLTLRFPGEWEREFDDDYYAKSLRPVRWSLLIMALLMTISLVQDSLEGPESLADDSGPILIAMFLAFFAVTFTRLSRSLLQPILFLLVLLLGLISIAALARAANGQSTLTAAALDLVITFIYAFTFSRLEFVHAVMASAIVAAAFFMTAVDVPGTADSGFTFLIPLAFIFTLVSGYVIERHIRGEFVAKRLLAAERERSERLLLNILPGPIADRLKAGEEPIADSYAEVTVLFADVVNFTELSTSISPREIVGMLNAVFSDFDRLAATHRLEKIKTIGDSYMVVSGVPLHDPDNAAAIADMALAMRDAVARHRAPNGEPLRVRIGIHTGPVVAGVIGRAKFAYDLWGDAVNTASRMESHGVPDAIQVSKSTYQRLEGRFVFEARGTIDVKGKGPMATYLLLSRRWSADELTVPEPRNPLASRP